MIMNQKNSRSSFPSAVNSLFEEKSLSFFSRNFSAIAIFLFIGMSALKMRAYLAQGRFWAEEGAVFFPAISGRSAWEALFNVFNGHVELITNFVVYLASLFNFKHAPLVTSYFSFTFQLLPIFIIVLYRENLQLSKLKVLILLIVAAGLPQASEVWANSINLHFHFALLASLLLALGSDGPSGIIKRVLLLLCGLSGIPANFLAPLAALLAFFRGTKDDKINFLILALTSMFQITFLLLNRSNLGHRDFFADQLVLFLAPLAQTFISPVLGVRIGDVLSGMLRGAFEGDVFALCLALVFFIPVFFILAALLKGRREKPLILMAAFVILLVMSVATALGDKKFMVSPASGGRYFYAPNLLILLAILVNFEKFNIAAKICLISLVLNSLVNVKNFMGGPAWRPSLHEAVERNDSSVNIWPTGWRMERPSK
jgi:hypothetical protein